MQTTVETVKSQQNADHFLTLIKIDTYSDNGLDLEPTLIAVILQQELTDGKMEKLLQELQILDGLLLNQLAQDTGQDQKHAQ